MTIRDTRRSEDGANGEGLIVFDSGEVIVERGLFVRNSSASIAVEGRMAELSDVEIRETLSSMCDHMENCLGAELGTGILGLNGVMTLRNFLIRDNALAGIQLIKTAGFTARDGFVTGNRIGVNVQVPDLDIPSSFTNVRAFDNDVDFDARALGDVDLDALLEDLVSR